MTLRKMSDVDRADPKCLICDGHGWVCENHPLVPWAPLTGQPECCGGAGAPCTCNPLAHEATTK